MRLDTDVGHNVGGVEIRALCRSLKVTYTELGKSFLYRSGFVHRYAVMMEQERAFPKPISEMLFDAVALKYTSIR